MQSSMTRMKMTPSGVCGWHTRGKRCHPEGPGQAAEVGLCEPHEVQQGQVQGPALGRGNPKHKYRLGGEWTESSPEEKDLEVLGDEKLNMTQQCVLAAQQTSRALGCIPSSVGTGREGGFCPSAPLC